MDKNGIDVKTVAAAVALVGKIPGSAAQRAEAAQAGAEAAQTAAEQAQEAAEQAAQSVDTATVAETKEYLGIVEEE